MEGSQILFEGRLVMLGFGAIGQGVLPLILRHLSFDKQKMTIIAADDSGKAVAEEFGVSFRNLPLTADNYLGILTPLIGEGDFLLNLSVNVSTVALIEFCQSAGALYLDTCIEPWEGLYTNPELTTADRSNYKLREEALALRQKYPHGKTALLAHGANPGLVSHFVKYALLDIAASDERFKGYKPSSRMEWAEFARNLGVKVIHIAERDTQDTALMKQRDEFVNTWSVEGFINEGLQPAELGWGTHEKELPKDGFRHDSGCQSAIYINRPGASVRVRSWTPQEGPYLGFLIAHNEAISLADYLSLTTDDVTVAYRPTVHYAYHPCADAVLSLHELAGKNWTIPSAMRIMKEEIQSGEDESGVLLMGHAKGAYWFGSILSIQEAKQLAPYNNATSLQVTSAVLAGLIWAIENPDCGIIEAEEADYERIIEIARPYLGRLEGHFSTWTPLEGRQLLYVENLDLKDPWQFKNFEVH